MAEQLRTNKITETLFVGVGGIGSEIVVKVAEKCSGNELENARFVVMDTDANSLKNVKNSKAVITKVQTSSTQSVKDYLDHDLDAKLHWFPNNTTLYGKTVSEGAGQVRAISRLALNKTVRTGEIQKLYKEIDSLFLKDDGDLKQALRVVIVSSATGGTGSGMAMITSMLIRDYLAEHYSEKSAIIRGFFVLPSVLDTVITTQAERESQYRNGYATIKEINAFMMKGSGFCGTEKELQRYENLHIDVPTPTGETKSLSCIPFDFCFLLERADKNVEGMDDLEQYKEMAARSIYEQNIGPMQSRAFSLEDNVIKEISTKGNFGRNRFGGIGASVVRYPFEDIADYIAYSRAMQRIGGEEASGDWSAYDKQYERDFAEYKKKRSFTSEKAPTRASSYMEALERDNSRFGKDIKNDICGSEDIDTRVKIMIETYLDDLETYIKQEYKKRDDYYDSTDQIKNHATKYSDENKQQPSTDILRLREFHTNSQSKAHNMATNIAKSIYYSAPNVDSTDIKPYQLEYLVKTVTGTVHPNSMRYIFYKLKDAMEIRRQEAKGLREKNRETIKKYSDGYSAPDNDRTFDIVARFSPDTERNIDALINLAMEDRSFFERREDGYDNIWKKLNLMLPEYGEALLENLDGLLFDATYTIAIDYLNSLCEVLETFYDSFDAKVVTLARRKEDIVDALKNEKGSVVYNLCATKEKLDEMLRRSPEGTEGFLLPAELNSRIFETVKKNAEYTRLKIYDPYTADTSVDIFDDVLINYFKRTVREDSGEKIDINIVKAIFLDKELTDFIELNRFKEGKDIVNPVRDDIANKAYFKDILRIGEKLATPGISGISFNEPRNIQICTFSDTLLDMRSIKVKEFIEGQKFQPVASNTVSKYELRFFDAIYNITPNIIPPFRGPEYNRYDGTVNEAAAGIYFKAYQNYNKHIGPDSMKSSTISTHIDKRWDTVAELPELDFDVLYEEMIKIHSSLIYGLVLEMIRKFPSSKHDAGKRVYKLENEDGDRIDFIISNGTDCDEFYEVLDALYRDRASSTMILEAAYDYGKIDIEKNHRYDESAFVRNLNKLRLPDGHKHPTSLFEIPLAYYNSLPSMLTDDNELSVMIDSVIRVIEQEVNKFEKVQDQKPYLCRLLEEQFQLLVDTFNNDEYDEVYAIRKNTKIYENIVVGMVCRKIIKKFKEIDISDCAERVGKLREIIREPEDGEV